MGKEGGGIVCLGSHAIFFACQALVKEGGVRIKVTFNLLLIHNVQQEDLANLAMMGC